MATLHTNHFDANHHQLSRSSSDMSVSGEIGAGSSDLSQVDLESGGSEEKLHLGGKNERDCRICHLGLENNGQENGVAIELGCSCKGDLGAAHKKCAETWFKIKGSMICEICGAAARNVAVEQANEAHYAASAVSSAPAAPLILVETQTFWHSRRVMNFLLACMVFAFVISWLFHFKILS